MLQSTERIGAENGDSSDDTGRLKQETYSTYCKLVTRNLRNKASQQVVDFRVAVIMRSHQS